MLYTILYIKLHYTIIQYNTIHCHCTALHNTSLHLCSTTLLLVLLSIRTTSHCIAHTLHYCIAQHFTALVLYSTYKYSLHCTLYCTSMNYATLLTATHCSVPTAHIPATVRSVNPTPCVVSPVTCHLSLSKSLLCHRLVTIGHLSLSLSCMHGHRDY